MIADISISGLVMSQAHGVDDMEHVRRLFQDYQAWLDVDLCFQDFERELAELPGFYAPPGGIVILARDAADGRVAAGVGVRPLEGEICEMKRLYVRQPWRRLGLGRRLVELTLSFAGDAGYRQMRLDTLPKLTEAIGLYESMGFVKVPAYYNNPLDGVIYLQRPVGEV